MLGPSNQDGPWPPPGRPWHSLRDPLDFPTSRNQPLSSYVVLLGSISSYPQADEPQEFQAVAQFIIYPDYSEKLGTGDIALVQLASPVNFTDLILPVCLPKPGDPLGNGTWCWVTGWGNIAANQRKDTGSVVGGGGWGPVWAGPPWPAAPATTLTQDGPGACTPGWAEHRGAGEIPGPPSDKQPAAPDPLPGSPKAPAEDPPGSFQLLLAPGNAWCPWAGGPSLPPSSPGLSPGGLRVLCFSVLPGSRMTSP